MEYFFLIMNTRQTSRSPKKGSSTKKNTRSTSRSVVGETKKDLGSLSATRGSGIPTHDKSRVNLFQSPFQTITNLLRTPTRGNSLDIAVAQIPVSGAVSRSTSYTDLNIGTKALGKTSHSSDIDISRSKINDSTELGTDNLRASNVPSITATNCPAMNLDLNMDPNLNNAPTLDVNVNFGSYIERLEHPSTDVPQFKNAINAIDPILLSLKQMILSTQDEFRSQLSLINQYLICRKLTLHKPHNLCNQTLGQTPVVVVLPIRSSLKNGILNTTASEDFQIFYSK